MIRRDCVRYFNMVPQLGQNRFLHYWCQSSAFAGTRDIPGVTSWTVLCVFHDEWAQYLSSGQEMLQPNHRAASAYHTAYVRTPNYTDVHGVVCTNNRTPRSLTVCIHRLPTKTSQAILRLEAALGSSYFLLEGVPLKHRCKHKLDVPTLSIDLAQAFFLARSSRVF